MTLAVARVPVPAVRLVPAVTFSMGAPDEGDKFASALEKPRHAVRLGAFAMGVTPVTFEEWDAYSAETGTRRPRDFGWGRGRNPVIDVAWDDAVAYVRWLVAHTGKPFRLPTEAEWEHCCRGNPSGNATTAFGTGDSLTVEQANFLYTDVRERPGVGRPVPVASYPPNALGLFDMHGNVCQLVADVWHDSYAGAPCDGSARADHADCPWRVVRGGGWDAMPRILRCAYRDWVHRSSRFDNVGFRVAWDVAG